jgi:hypothetical protein
MNPLKGGILVALVLLCALAVVGAPAFATVANTTSVMNVGPFFTPIGNTDNSSSTFASPRVDFSAVAFDGRVVTVTCVAGASGYVPNTHTRVLITAMGFGGCVPSIGAGAMVRTSATSATPFGWHVTSTVVMTPASWFTTLAIPAGQNISIVINLGGGRFCGMTIGQQSIKATDTNVTRTVVFNDPTIRFILDAGSDPVLCPDPARTITMTGTYTYRPDTAADMFRSTAGS